MEFLPIFLPIKKSKWRYFPPFLPKSYGILLKETETIIILIDLQGWVVSEGCLFFYI